jgi:XdhC and CoxI family
MQTCLHIAFWVRLAKIQLLTMLKPIRSRHAIWVGYSECRTYAERGRGVNDMFDKAAEWRREGRDVAMATVVATWGSAPVPIGSQLAVDGRGCFTGSVSGGCIEAAVVEEALAVLADGKPRLLSFGVTNEMAWEVGLACGGRIEVFVERVE